MGEVIGCCISLNRELQLGNDFLTHGNFQSHIADGLRVCEPAFYLNDLEPMLLILDELLDVLNGQYDVLDLEEYTSTSDYIVYPECDICLLFEYLVDSTFVIFVLDLIDFFDSVLQDLFRIQFLVK